MRTLNVNHRQTVIFSVIAACLGSLLSLNASAATCPCDLSLIDESAWGIDATAHSFEKVGIDTGVLCEDNISVGSYSSGRFSIFKRFVGINAGQKSEALAEIKIEMASGGTLCIVQTENTGLFDSTPTVKEIKDSISKDEFAACVVAAKDYTKRFGMTCEKKS